MVLKSRSAYQTIAKGRGAGTLKARTEREAIQISEADFYIEADEHDICYLGGTTTE